MEVGKEGGNMEGRGRLCLSLHCRHQKDSCIKIGSDESHFNVSLIVRDKVHKKNVHPYVASLFCSYWRLQALAICCPKVDNGMLNVRNVLNV